jgi:hypothetical protein
VRSSLGGASNLADCEHKGYRVLVLPDFLDLLLSASIVPILTSVRLHAARHSAFVMWVSRSQKLIQSARVCPPPPGALAAASLALALTGGAPIVRPVPKDPGVPSDDDRLVGDPPLDSGTVEIWGDMEGSGWSEGSGAPIADDGAGFRAPVAGFTGVTAGAVCAAAREGL